MEPINAYGAGFAAAKDEKRRIWLLGSLSGGAVLLYIFLQNLLVGALRLVGLYEAYASNSLMQAGVDILLVLSCLLLPFLLFVKFSLPESRHQAGRLHPGPQYRSRIHAYL